MFFANPKPVKRMQLNQLLKITKPSSRVLIDLDHSLTRFVEFVKNKNSGLDAPEFNQDINLLHEEIEKDKSSSLIENCVAALLFLHNKYTEFNEEDIDDDDDGGGSYEDSRELNVFRNISLTELSRQFVLEGERENFAKAILNKPFIIKKLEYIERLFGKDKKNSLSIAKEIVLNIQGGTKYPPVVDEDVDEDDIVDLIDDIIDSLEKGTNSDEDDQDDDDDEE